MVVVNEQYNVVGNGNLEHDDALLLCHFVSAVSVTHSHQNHHAMEPRYST